jgi:hypothetical protein
MHAAGRICRDDAESQAISREMMTLKLLSAAQFSGFFRLSNQCMNRDIFGTPFNALRPADQLIELTPSGQA